MKLFNISSWQFFYRCDGLCKIQAYPSFPPKITPLHFTKILWRGKFYPTVKLNQVHEGRRASQFWIFINFLCQYWKEIERSIETYDKVGLSMIERKLQNSILHRPILFLYAYSVCNLVVPRLLVNDYVQTSPIEWSWSMNDWISNTVCTYFHK